MDQYKCAKYLTNERKLNGFMGTIANYFDTSFSRQNTTYFIKHGVCETIYNFCTNRTRSDTSASSTCFLTLRETILINNCVNLKTIKYDDDSNQLF